VTTNTKAATVATGAAFENQSADQRIGFSKASLPQPLQTFSQKITNGPISTMPTRCCPSCSSEYREACGWIIEAGTFRVIRFAALVPECIGAERRVNVAKSLRLWCDGLQKRRCRLVTNTQQKRGASSRQLLRLADLAAVLRACQRSARRFKQPLFDVVLARLLVRGAWGLDVTTEFDLAHKLAALERGEVCA
jgi:hypothetical protein